MLIIATAGDGSKSPSTGTHTNPLVPQLVSSFADPSTGISVRLPAGWKATKKRQVVRLESGDRTAIIALGAFPGAKRAPTLLASAVVTVRQTFPDVKIRSAPGNRLAGLPAKSALLRGHNKRKVPITVLLVGARGKKHAYVMDFFSTQVVPAKCSVSFSSRLERPACARRRRVTPAGHRSGSPRVRRSR